MTMLRWILPIALTGAVPTDGAEVGFTKADGRLSVVVDGRTIATYVFEDSRITRPYFEHLQTLGGVRVTRDNPPPDGQELSDHPTFHPGLWLAFGDLGGADFWRNRDPVRHVRFLDEPRGGPGQGSFAVRNRYLRGDRPIAEEDCRITFRTRPDGYMIVWESSFAPVGEPLVFGDQEEMGLGIRLAPPLAVVRGGRITDSEGRRNEAQVWGQQADWCSYLGTRNDRPVGVALIPDPSNFRRCWFHARDYGLLVANPFGRQAFTRGEPSRVEVPPGESLRLRFGVFVFDGAADVGVAARDFRALADPIRDDR